MTVKVNMITMMRNSFSRAGKNANIEIACLKEAGGVVYQRSLKNGIALLHKKNNMEDELRIISSNGVEAIKTVKNNYTNISGGVYKIFESEKQYFRGLGGKFAELKNVFVQRLSDSKIVESAHKVVCKDKSNELMVFAAGDNPHFPITRLAGSIHPTASEKSMMKNGDYLYLEQHKI